MDVLQHALNEALATIPEIVLEKIVFRKLQEQGVSGTRTLSKKIAKHLVSGRKQVFRFGGKKHSGTLNLSFDQKDFKEIDEGVEKLTETFPSMLPSLAASFSKKILRSLKPKWTEEYVLQKADLAGFREHLEARWGEPLGQLRMLLTMAREWGQWVHNRRNAKKGKKRTKEEILLRLHVRACQVADEIICLLENGFADGAMARWRTLHELAVIAVIISKHSDAIAQCYMDHQFVESKKALSKYLDCCQKLGFRPLPGREIKKITKAYDNVIKKYGNHFKSDYGWAATLLKKPRPTFADIEKAAGRDAMRSHYQMGSDNIHVGVKSLFVRLGLIDNYEGLLAGRSNGGLMEPGQNTAHSLTQVSVLVCLSGNSLDDLVAAGMMQSLRDEIPKAFHRADKELRKDDAQYRDA